VLEAPVAPTTPSDDLVRKAMEQRAELRALRKIVDANDYSHTAQKRAGLPQLVVSANGLSGQPNPRYIPVNKDNFKESWEVGVGIEWSPNNTLASVRSTRRASAQLQKARADLLAQEDAVRNEVVNAYQTYKSAEAVSAASQARLEAAEEAYRVRLATYRVGAGVIVDLLNADLDVTRARLAMAAAAIATRSALATLNRAAAISN
jgi:outer membrane protein TolC